MTGPQFRRLSRRLWMAEDRLLEWGSIVRRDRPPCDWPTISVIGKEIARRDAWLVAARRDPVEEPPWFPDFNSWVRTEFQGVRMTALRRIYVDRLPPDQVRRSLNMSRRGYDRFVTEVREKATSYIGA